ncbi:MAG: GerMN domain-containing protein [Actinomycetota bacterium]
MKIRVLALLTVLFVALAGCSRRDDPTVTASPPSGAGASPSPSLPAGTSPPAPTSSTTRVVDIFLVLTSDLVPPGAPTFGCGDAIQAAERTVPGTVPPLEAAIGALLAERTGNDPTAGPYSAFNDADLRLDSAAVGNGKATIRLEGELRPGGVCDGPRTEEQLTRTARQFPEVTAIEVFVNGVPLADVLSQR